MKSRMKIVIQEHTEFKDRWFKREKINTGNHTPPSRGSPVCRVFAGVQCHRGSRPFGEPHVQHRHLTPDSRSTQTLSRSISPHDRELGSRAHGFCLEEAG